MRENKRERARERVRAEQAGRAPQHLTLFPSGACYEHQLKAHGPSRTCSESKKKMSNINQSLTMPVPDRQLVPVGPFFFWPTNIQHCSAGCATQLLNLFQ